MSFLRSIAGTLFGVFRPRRERSELADARRYVASVDAFCREFCVDQAGDDRHQGDGDGYDGWLAVEDRYEVEP